MRISNLLASTQVEWRDLEEIAAPNFKDKKLGPTISLVLPYIYIVAGLILLFFLIYSGYLYMTSAGDAKVMEQAKKNITYAIVGFIVIFASYWAIQLMGFVLGVNQWRIMFQ